MEDIERRSLALLGKGKAARILDKKQDSGMVVRLVEELRQAILIYQVCPAEDHRPGQVDPFGIVIATTVNRQPGRTVDCKFFSTPLPLELMGGWAIEVFFR